MQFIKEENVNIYTSKTLLNIKNNDWEGYRKYICVEYVFRWDKK